MELYIWCAFVEQDDTAFSGSPRPVVGVAGFFSSFFWYPFPCVLGYITYVALLLLHLFFLISFVKLHFPSDSRRPSLRVLYKPMILDLISMCDYLHY